METSRLFSFVLFVLSTLTVSESSTDDLISTVVLYRHGDRAPIKPYKYDVYDESYWHSGYGQLTKIGKQQQYALGKWLRGRYDDSLPIEYNKSDITVLSSNVDRCLMSAAINLAALYPPKGDQVWNRGISWQPVPIHTKPEAEDAILAQEKPCPKYTKLYNELMESDEPQSILKAHEQLFRTLTEKSGDNITTFEPLLYLYDTLYIENLYNLSLPLWARDVLGEEGEGLCGYGWSTYAYTTNLARLRTGPLINLIVEQFENVIGNPSSTSKFLMLSAHDSTIAPLLTAMQVYDFKWPHYASTVVFELRKGKESDYVNIFYKNPDVPVNLTLPGCNFDCDISKFTKLLEPIRLNLVEWENECLQI